MALLDLFDRGRRRRDFVAALERAIPSQISTQARATPSNALFPWLERDSASPRKRCYHPGSEYVGMESELRYILRSKNRAAFKKWLEEVPPALPEQD